MTPHTVPRSHGAPRPVSEPSSDSASAKPMEMPAPTEAAMPTRKVSQVWWVAKAAANSGASPFAYTSFQQFFGDPDFEYSTAMWSFFVQDDWRLGPDVKILYGLRYDIYHPDLILVGRHDLMIGFSSPNSPTIYDRVVRVALVHIVGLEELPISAPTTNGPT